MGIEPRSPAQHITTVESGESAAAAAHHISSPTTTPAVTRDSSAAKLKRNCRPVGSPARRAAPGTWRVQTTHRWEHRPGSTTLSHAAQGVSALTRT